MVVDRLDPDRHIGGGGQLFRHAPPAAAPKGDIADDHAVTRGGDEDGFAAAGNGQSVPPRPTLAGFRKPFGEIAVGQQGGIGVAPGVDMDARDGAGVGRRRRPDYAVQETEIYIRKVRFKAVGRVGRVTLAYDKVTGRYSDLAGVPR